MCSEAVLGSMGHSRFHPSTSVSCRAVEKSFNLGVESSLLGSFQFVPGSGHHPSPQPCCLLGHRAASYSTERPAFLLPKRFELGGVIFSCTFYFLLTLCNLEIVINKFKDMFEVYL